MNLHRKCCQKTSEIVLIMNIYSIYMKPKTGIFILIFKEKSMRMKTNLQEGSFSWSSSMHLYSYAMYICFSPCSSLQWTDSTLHTKYWVSMSFLNKGILKENTPQNHFIIFMIIAREIFCYVVETMMKWSVQISNFWANGQQSCP